MENPYQPPGADVPVPRTTATTLAALGAWAASGYWALLTGLIGLGALVGTVSAMQLILPVVLIGLYAVRGWQLFRGDTRVARNLLLLHVVGGLVSLLEIASGAAVVQVLYGGKLLVHGFGAVTAWLATRQDEGGSRSANPFA